MINKLKELADKLTRLFHLIKGLTQDEPYFTFPNGTRIQFTKEGDLLIKVDRALVTHSALTFINTPEHLIKKGIKAYEAGSEEYRSFLNKIELDIPIPVVDSNSPLNKSLIKESENG